MKNLTLFSVFLFIIQFSMAQSGLKLPEENADIAKEKYVLLADYYDSKTYEKAYAALDWIMGNAPDMHESVYIIGQKTIKNLLDNEPENDDYKSVLMKVYDNRIKYFGNEVKVLNRKAYDAYRYYRNEPQKLDETMAIFEDLYEKNDHSLKDNLLYPYFDLKVMQRKSDVFNDKELIVSYELISDMINVRLEQAPNENLEKVQKLIDAKLAESVQLDCKRINDLFISDINELNVQKAKLILKLSIAYKCTDQQYFITAIKVIFEEDPNGKLAKIVASYHFDKREFDQAIEFFNKSIDLTEDPQEKASIYYDMANVYSMKGDKIKSREFAYKSLKLNPENLDNYRLIGDLYYNSYDDCKKGKSRVEDRSVFYAAYEKYALAKKTDKMKLAEQQFPSMENIHTENFQEGQIINTNCWVGELVKVRRRPNLASN